MFAPALLFLRGIGAKTWLVLGLLLALTLSHGFVYFKGKSVQREEYEVKTAVAYQKELDAQTKLAEARAIRNEKAAEALGKSQAELNKLVEGVTSSVENNPSPSDCVIPSDELSVLQALISKTNPSSR